MEVTLFGVISYRPLWQKQLIEDEHILVKLILGTIGYTISFWIFPIWFTSLFSIAFLRSLQREGSLILSTLANFTPNLIIGILIAFTINLLSLRFLLKIDLSEIMLYFNEFRYDIKESIDLQYEKTQNSYSAQKYYLIILVIIVLGFVAGIIEGVLWYIPMYILYIFLVFVIANFINLSSSLFLISILLAWAVIFGYKYREKFNLHEVQISGNEKSEYEITKRSIDIVTSDKEPIICPACRSFIASNSQRCPVCDEVLK